MSNGFYYVTECAATKLGQWTSTERTSQSFSTNHHDSFSSRSSSQLVSLCLHFYIYTPLFFSCLLNFINVCVVSVELNEQDNWAEEPEFY